VQNSAPPLDFLKCRPNAIDQAPFGRFITNDIGYFFLGFTVSCGGVEQVFRPAVKLDYPPASAAEVHRMDTR
jgi:hypothetical protein